MHKYTAGEKVSWKWIERTASGTVEEVCHERTQIVSKDTLVTRNGTEDNPAIIIRQDNGTKVLKLASELK